MLRPIPSTAVPLSVATADCSANDDQGSSPPVPTWHQHCPPRRTQHTRPAHRQPGLRLPLRQRCNRPDHGRPRTHRTRPLTPKKHGPRPLNRFTFTPGGPEKEPLASCSTVNTEEVIYRPLLSTKPVRSAECRTTPYRKGKRSPSRVSAAQSHFVVGDTGIEPVTSSVSGINTVLSNSPLSTKTNRGRPLKSAEIRGRCHAISQSPPSPWTRAGICHVDCWNVIYDPL